ncbi:hypothetical protein H9Q10_08620 [Eikenella sp. S3360]|uniref:Lipoprotein n=1 Tax=Eikenella glucosivorans TaxID=2766967 RepID=A0ABS0NBP0_9NEIS|nr:hypothetical protein [Eikenella glucosivorans]MBH5329730.1 hypothetical protein [Eikenella glucosivorans]
MSSALKLLPLLLALGACSSVGTQFAKMSEPESGERARVRVVANMLVKGVPESDCLDWRKPGAGTIFGGMVGSSGYRGRSLNMPDPHNVSGSRRSAEFYVRAGKPLTLQLLNTPDSWQTCSLAISFVPQAGHNYEVAMITGQVDYQPDLGYCAARVFDLNSGRQIQAEETTSCRRRQRLEARQRQREARRAARAAQAERAAQTAQ